MIIIIPIIVISGYISYKCYKLIDDLENNRVLTIYKELEPLCMVDKIEEKLDPEDTDDTEEYVII